MEETKNNIRDAVKFLVDKLNSNFNQYKWELTSNPNKFPMIYKYNGDNQELDIKLEISGGRYSVDCGSRSGQMIAFFEVENKNGLQDSLWSSEYSVVSELAEKISHQCVEEARSDMVKKILNII